MKFLLFNVTVGVALAYLLGFGPIEGLLPQAEASRQTATEKIAAPAPKPAPKPEPAAAVVDPAPDPVVEPVPTRNVPTRNVRKASAPSSPPPLPEAVEVAKVEPKPAPKPAPVPEAASGIAPEIADTAIEATEPQSTFPGSNESAAERNRSLRDLVLDMERMVADKLMR